MTRDMYRPAFSQLKFRGLILYAAHRAREADDRWFGATKLNKILFYADWVAFRRLGHSLTGATYQKLPAGPAPRQLLANRDALIADEQATLKARPVMNYVQHRIIPTAPEIDPTDYFSAEEREIVDEVIDTLAPMTAADVSELSHREIGWRAAKLGAEIPYETALLSPAAPDDEDDWYATVLAASDSET